MITIDQLLESVDLNFKPRWVTKDESGLIAIWDDKPSKDLANDVWIEQTEFVVLPHIKLADFANKNWTQCIYEVPRKKTGKIEKLDIIKDTRNVIDKDGIIHTVANFTTVEKINELVDYVNALIESNNIHEKQIDELQMKLEPEKCAVNELKGAKNE